MLKIKLAAYQPQFLCKQIKPTRPYTPPVQWAFLLSSVQLFHAFVLDVRRLDTRSFTNHFMWIQQVSSGLLPLPSIHLKSLLCSNGPENTVVMVKKKWKMLQFHRSAGKWCPQWVSVQLRMGCWDVTYYLGSRLAWVWTLLSRSWEGVRNSSVISDYRNFCSVFAAS